MKKYLILFLLLTNALLAPAQRIPELVPEKVRINGTDKNIVAEIGPAAHTRNADPSKLYYWYSSNLIQVTQGGYEGHPLHGLYIEFYLNKNLKEQGNFKKGLKDKQWREWSADGRLLKTITWKEGKLSGPFVYYNSEGQLKQSGKNKNGLLNGPVSDYITADSVTTIYYEKGKPLTSRPSLLQRINIFRKH